MGCWTSTDQNNGEITRYLNMHDKADRVIKKLLLLGSGSSGKSTLFKQLKCIYDVGFEETELEACRHTLRQNVVMGMLTLLRKSQELYDKNPDTYRALQVNMNDQNICDAIQLVVEFGTETFATEQLPPNDKMKALGESIGLLWDLDPIQATFMHRGDRFSFPDNMDYFFNKAELLYLEDFQPNKEDALKTRIRTTGLIDRQYEIKENYFHIYDVGGQRNERKKWIHSFENVTAVIFVAALNHYNAVLFEDEKKNAMHESIELFDEICNSKWFRKTEMILFLNKNDLYRELLREGYSLKNCFHSRCGWEGDQWDPDMTNNTDTDNTYNNNNSNTNDNGYDMVDYEKKDDIQKDNEFFEFCYEQSIQFIQDQYVKRNKNPQKLVFVHVTTATNRDNIEKVFWDVQNMIIRSNLKRGGIV